MDSESNELRSPPQVARKLSIGKPTSLLSIDAPPAEGTGLLQKVPLKKNPQRNSRLEEQINFEHLQHLERSFQKANKRHRGRLKLEDFRRAMKKAMGEDICDRELEVLFMKIDMDCDGFVDWDEYISYMLLEYQGKSNMSDLMKEVPFPYPLRDLRSNHKDAVVRLTFLQNLINRSGYTASDLENPGGKFLSLSKDGQLGIYNFDYSLIKTLQIRHNKDSSLGAWLTDMAPCSNVSLVAISSTEREISFYDISGTKFERKYQIVAFKDPIITLNYSFNYDNLNESVLVASDSVGTVIVFRFFQALRNGLFGNSLQKGVVRKATLLALIKQKIEGSRCVVFENTHSKLVNCAQYFQLAQGMECFLSCCASTHDSMFLGDLTNITYKPSWPGYIKKASNKNNCFKVKRGILAFDYSREWNLIVTGSFDGIIRTWNPTSSKPVSLIKCHHSPVTHVLTMPGTGQVISATKHKILKVVELKDNSTYQTIPSRTFSSLGPTHHKISSMYFHKWSKALFVATMKVGVLEGSECHVTTPTGARSHSSSVSKVLYSKLFDQVVTAGHDSIVSVWDLNTGVKLIQFKVEEGSEITAMTFDVTERQLVIGCRNGSLSVWNFNNGSRLRVLSHENGQEVTGIVCDKKRILTAGWSRRMKVYLDPLKDGDRHRVKTKEWEELHKDDILCLSAFHHPNGVSIVASCSYDGNILIWSLDSGDVLCYLNKKNSYSPLSTNGIIIDKSFNRKQTRPTTADRRGAISSTCSRPSYDGGTPLRELLASKSFVPSEEIQKELDQILEESIIDDKAFAYPRKIQFNASQQFSNSQLLKPPSRSKTRTSSKLFSSSSLAKKCESSNSSNGERLTPSPHVLQHKLKDKKDLYLAPSSGQVVDNTLIKNHQSSDVKVLVDHESSRQIVMPAITMEISSPSIHNADLTASQHTRQQVQALTGQAKSVQWEAESSVTQVLFLQTRPHSPTTATLFASGGIGWVYAWSVHPNGGLLGQFIGAHKDEGIVLALATDLENKYLFTGDSSGHLKVWEIAEYCYKKPKREEAIRDLLQVQLKTQLLSKNERNFLSSTRQNRLRRHPPETKVSFRAHVAAISAIKVISDKEMFVTTSLDGTVRLWTISGLFVGTFGQKQSWNIAFPREGVRMPNEIRRIASSNTLRTLNAGYSSWNRAKRLIKLAVQRSKKDRGSRLSRGDEASDFSLDAMEDDDGPELEYMRISEELPHSKILGHSYKPTRKHRILPSIKIKPVSRNLQVHSSLKFSTLEEIPCIAVPGILKEKWRMQKAATESEQRLKTKRLSCSNRSSPNRSYLRHKESGGSPSNKKTNLSRRVFPKIK